MYTKNDIIEQLNKMNAPRDSIVLVHSSLRLVGEVDGGAQTLLDALIEYFTEKGGLLCIAAHTWANIGKPCITLDMQNPVSNLGAFPNFAMQDGRGVLTKNPTHAMVVFGDKQKIEQFVKDEPNLKTPTAPNSCYGKLANGGYTLLIGVAQDKNTYLHSVEEMLGISNRMASAPTAVTVRDENGTVTEHMLTFFESDFTDDVSLFFPKYETAFRYHRCITDGFIGNAPTQLCDCAKIKQTLELIYERANGVDPLKTPKAIPQKLYC